jgi:hypothetical protein
MLAPITPVPINPIDQLLIIEKPPINYTSSYPASGFFRAGSEKSFSKIRDILWRLYLDSAGVCTLAELRKTSIHLTTHRGGIFHTCRYSFDT